MLRKRLTYANVVSTLCMFIVLGGSATAAVALKKNSVLSKHIKNGQVTTKDVKNGSLLKKDFKSGQLPAGPAGQDGSADAFARVATDGTLQPNVAGFPSQVKNVDGTDVVKPATGTYCFGSLNSRPASALVSLDNADAGAADRNLVTSVAISRGENLGDCPASHNQARVRIVDGNTGAAQDGRFFVWFEQ